MAHTTRRLLKETQELSPAARNPDPTFHAAPVSGANLYEWHFTLLGPPATPYAGGIYHGRITLPPAYPMKPPNFRFLTPSGRFEVNREICLSISGFHEETWQPAWGVRLALTALRGFMAEEGAGQVGGLESPKHVRERMARESGRWVCGCEGGLSNEERMKAWWDICRSKGVDVEREIEGLGKLPEDMKLEARVRASGPEVVQDSARGETSHPQISPSETSAVTAESDATTTNEGSLQPPASTVALRPLPQLQIERRPPEQSPVSIDRAIGVVLLALCLMILKKVFYPGSTSSLFGGSDELHMIRE